MTLYIYNDSLHLIVQGSTRSTIYRPLIHVHVGGPGYDSVCLCVRIMTFELMTFDL